MVQSILIMFVVSLISDSCLERMSKSVAVSTRSTEPAMFTCHGGVSVAVKWKVKRSAVSSLKTILVDQVNSYLMTEKTGCSAVPPPWARDRHLLAHEGLELLYPECHNEQLLGLERILLQSHASLQIHTAHLRRLSMLTQMCLMDLTFRTSSQYK